MNIFRRSVVFQPDSPAATLERHGLAFVDGFWTEGWVVVCVGPCTASIPLGSPYRVSGSGVRRSRELTLEPGRTPLRLEVTTGAAWTLPMGVVATAVGGAGLLAGFAGWGLASVCFADQEGETCDSSEQQRHAGIVMAVGAATLVTGIVLLSSQRTTVAEIQTSDGASPRAGRLAVPLGGVWLTPRGIEF